MTRLLALLCGFLIVLSCILAGLLFRRAGSESTNDVNVNTHVSVNTPGGDNASVHVRRDSTDASHVDIDVQDGSEAQPPSAPSPPSATSEDAASRALLDERRYAEGRLRRQKQDNLDALIATGLRISSDAQSWSLKPHAFGGPTEDESIADVLFTDIGYSNVTDGVFPTIDGRFWMENSSVALVVVGENQTFHNRIVVTVTGSAPSDIQMRVAPE